MIVDPILSTVEEGRLSKKEMILKCSCPATEAPCEDRQNRSAILDAVPAQDTEFNKA
jgi:hypothetical protein